MQLNKTAKLLLLFINAIIYGQTHNGNVKYKVKFDESPKTSKNVEVNKINSQIEEKTKEFDFILMFSSEKKSSFINEEKLDDTLDENNKFVTKLALLKICPYSYFYDFDKNILLLETREHTLIEMKYEKLNWTITDESKLIDKYLCYKAYTTKIIINKNREQKEIAITAWFAPSIPFSFGPKDYNGLPGLILELQERNFTFYATTINLSDKKKIINLPKRKTITYEEYERKVLSRN